MQSDFLTSSNERYPFYFPESLKSVLQIVLVIAAVSVFRRIGLRRLAADRIAGDYVGPRGSADVLRGAAIRAGELRGSNHRRRWAVFLITLSAMRAATAGSSLSAGRAAVLGAERRAISNRNKSERNNP